jgi:hypothetical protein
MLDLLNRWQDLAGAIVGGIFALWVAFVVARDARFRAERTAAMTIIGALTRLRAAYNGAVRAAPKEKGDDGIAVYVAAQFALQSPLPSESFAPSAASLFHLDGHLAAHLTLIETLLDHIRHPLGRTERDLEEISRNPIERRNPDFPRNMQDKLADARMIKAYTQGILDHTDCVFALFDAIVLPRMRTYHRLRLWLAPNKRERWCTEALQSGKFRQADNTTA